MIDILRLETTGHLQVKQCNEDDTSRQVSVLDDQVGQGSLRALQRGNRGCVQEMSQ